MKKIIIILLFVFSIISCERPANISTLKTFHKNGISFKYPSNWDVTEDIGSSDEIRVIILETPGDAIFIFQIYGKKSGLNLNEFSQLFSEGASEEMPIGKMIGSKFSETKRTFGSRQLFSIGETFLVTILGEKIPHVREYFYISNEEIEVFLISQVAKEDLHYVKKGFDVVLKSFKI